MKRRGSTALLRHFFCEKHQPCISHLASAICQNFAKRLFAEEVKAVYLQLIDELYSLR
ncbi:MAG: hypothetical protein HRT88_22225 [Lentisphaeraceae bacterium]|nr:hypothetical protein [Lentisphaeraceae bacterium]